MMREFRTPETRDSRAGAEPARLQRAAEAAFAPRSAPRTPVRIAAAGKGLRPAWDEI